MDEKKITAYGMVSDLGHPQALGRALTKFRNIDKKSKKVDAVLSLGGLEKNLDDILTSCEMLGLFGVPVYVDDSYFKVESARALRIFRSVFRNLDFVNMNGRNVEKSSHDIVFVNGYDKKGDEGMKNVLNRVVEPEKTIVLSHRPIYPALGIPGERSLAHALRDAGVTKFASASAQKSFYDGRDLAGRKIGEMQETKELVWDAGFLKHGQCGVLYAAEGGAVSYKDISIKGEKGFFEGLAR